MAYLDDERSVANSAPVELYKFVGTYSLYTYTSGPEDVEFDDGGGLLVYRAIAIERSEVKVGTQDDDGTDLNVKMSVLQQICVDYAFTVSPPDLTLTVYRQQPTGYGTYWHGPVTNINVDANGRASLNCPSTLGAALVGNVPNVYYQTPCNNVLYDGRCKVDYASNSNVTTVSAVSADGKTVTVAGIGGLDGKLIGGELALGTGEIRMITAQAANVLTVNFPFNTIDIGGAATIAAGCDHLYRGDCKTKFANQINFNGFMFIPPDNPFSTGIQPGTEGVTDDACVYTHETFFAKMVFDYTDAPLAGPGLSGGMNISIYRGGVEIAFVSSYGGSPGAWSNTTDGDGNITSETVILDNTTFNFTTDSDPFDGGPPDRIHIQQQYPAIAFPDGNGLAKTTFQLPNETPIQLITTAGNAGVSVNDIPFGPGTHYHDCIPLWPNDTDLGL